MGATTRREPVRNTIPKAKAYQYYNVLDFKGIEITDNPFNASTGSCSDCLNVYVDKEGSLTTRPRLEIMSELKNIVALQNATFIGVYGLVEGYLIHCIINNANKFYRYANNTLTAIIDTDNLCPATRCKTFEQNDVIYILTGNNYLNIIDNDLSEVEGYIPTVKLKVNANTEGSELETYNILTNKYYEEYAWDFKSPIDLNSDDEFILSTDMFTTYKTEAFIEEDIDDNHWIKPLSFFTDGSYIGYVKDDVNETYYLYSVKIILTNEGFRSRQINQIQLGNITNFYTHRANLDVYTYEDMYFIITYGSTTGYYNFNNIVNDIIAATYIIDTVHLGGEQLYVSIAMTERYILMRRYDGFSLYDIYTNNATVIPFSGDYLDIYYFALDKDNQHLCLIDEYNGHSEPGLYAYETTITDFKALTSITGSMFRTNGTKIGNSHLDITQHGRKCAYTYSTHKFMVANNVIDVASGNKVKLLDNTIYNSDFLYANPTTGYYVLPFKNDNENTIILLYPDAINNPKAFITINISKILSNDKYLYNVTDFKYGQNYSVPTKWSGSIYNPKNNEFHLSVTLKNNNNMYSDIAMAITLKQGSALKCVKTLNSEADVDSQKWAERRQTFLKSLITSRFFNQRWFTSGSHIFYTNNNDPTYIPLYNYDLLGDDGYEVTGLNVISDTGMVAYTNKQLSIITPVKDRGDGNWDYSFTETKNTTGNIAKGNTIVTSYSTLPLQIDYKGIFTIQQTENVVSEANVVTPITNAIMRKWMKESETSRNMVENTRTMNYLYWTYFLLDTGTNTKVYVLDNRTLSWFYWEIPIRVMDMYVKDEEVVFFDYNGVKYAMKTEDINEHNNNEYNLRTYYDELPEANEIIHWYWNSQILPLGSINFSKQLVATTFILNDDENTDNYGLRYRFRGFRKTIYETDNRDIEGDLQYVRNKTVRSMFTRIQFLQILLSDKTDDLIGDYSRLRLVGLGFKYRLLEANRT